MAVNRALRAKVDRPRLRLSLRMASSKSCSSRESFGGEMGAVVVRTVGVAIGISVGVAVGGSSVGVAVGGASVGVGVGVLAGVGDG